MKASCLQARLHRHAEMEIGFIYSLKAFLLPPGLNLFGIFAGLALIRRHQRWAYTLLAFSTVTLYVLALPVAARVLAGQVEVFPAFRFADAGKPAQADCCTGRWSISRRTRIWRRHR